MLKRIGIGVGAVVALLLLGVALLAWQLPGIGAGALLFPTRRATTAPTPAGCVDRSFAGEGVTLAGWHCRTTASERKGTVLYLHGIADNRASAIGPIRTLLPLGFDVVAYDSRAHGNSEGDRCTYGFHEKRDLLRVLDQLEIDRAIVIGHSLGAAVALQAAAIEPRIRAVVAASTFSDLRTIATERALYFPSWSIGAAFERAERDGRFVVNDVSPVAAAAQITVPVLLIHGENDVDTNRAHSERVFAALRGSRELLIVNGAGHNDALTSRVWMDIERWLSALPHQ